MCEGFRVLHFLIMDCKFYIFHDEDSQTSLLFHPFSFRRIFYSVTKDQFGKAHFSIPLFLLQLCDHRVKIWVMFAHHNSERVGESHH